MFTHSSLLGYSAPLREPCTELHLALDQVHLWKIPLNPAPRSLARLAETLGSDERARANRFHFERDRKRFVAAHGQLRMILSRYVGISPRALQFGSGAYGKPFLGHPSGGAAIRFNLSHSTDLALLAVVREREIGVDLEEIHPIEDVAEIARRYFSPRETAALLGIPKERRCEEFLCCWTLKEAYLKAIGDGLTVPTDSFEVTLDRTASTRLISVASKPEEASRWSLIQLPFFERGFVGALAVKGHGWTLEQRQPQYCND